MYRISGKLKGEEDVLVAIREMPGAEPADDVGEFFVGFEDIVRVVALAAEFFHFLDLEAEDENVIVANFLADFNVGSVQGADGKGTIEGKLHVASAGSLLVAVEICSERSAAGMMVSARRRCSLVPPSACPQPGSLLIF